MAYDPKSYLTQALKTGFQDIYSTPVSTEYDAPRLEGQEARFGDVVVRPLMELFGQTEQDIGTPQQVGHAVSVPLTGQYAGYFRNDIYDNDGNFVRTTISEPDTDKYGLKALAQLGLTAASFGGLGTAGQLLSKGVSGIAALKSGDPSRILSAAMNIPGAGNLIPAELKTLMDYAGKAGQVQSALKGDPNAIFSLITGAAKSGALPKSPTAGQAASAGYGGADPGYFDPDAETAPLPDWALDPYKTEPEFLPASEVIRERQSLEDRFPPPEDTLNLEDFLPGTGRSTTTDQTIDIIGKREKDIPDWDVLPNLVTTPRTIRDVGPVTQIKPGEKLEGTTIKEPDLSKNLPTVPGGLKLPTKQPGKPATQGGLDLSQLAFLIGMMQHKPKQEEQQQSASPFPEYDDLMYGLSSRYA